MICKSLDPKDYADLQPGVAQAHKSYGWCLGHRIPVAWPHEHRLWEYASAFQAIGIHGPESVLDVGAGNSILGPHLALTGKTILEIDSSPNVYTDQRNKVMAKYTDKFTSEKTDFFDFPQGLYDCVCSISVMEHMPTERQQEAWTKLASLVAHNGLLVATIDYSDKEGEWQNADGRETQFGPKQLTNVLSWLYDAGMRYEADLTFHGNHVFDYSFYRIIAIKRSGL